MQVLCNSVFLVNSNFFPFPVSAPSYTGTKFCVAALSAFKGKDIVLLKRVVRFKAVL